MTEKLRKMLAMGSLALATTAGVAACASSQARSEDGCPPDRDLFAFSLTSDGTTYEDLSEAVAIVAKDNGYPRLTAEERERIAKASAAAIRSSGDAIVVDPHLDDTDMVVDLVVSVRGSKTEGYVPEGGSYCARVSSGDD
jgi:ABC-type glycerol-3-phosphate transport system substrate-binding protein